MCGLQEWDVVKLKNFCTPCTPGNNLPITLDLSLFGPALLHNAMDTPGVNTGSLQGCPVNLASAIDFTSLGTAINICKSGMSEIVMQSSLSNSLKQVD